MRAALAVLVLSVAIAAGCRERGPAAGAEDPLASALAAGGLTRAEDEGRRLFAARCAACHGEGGAGDGHNAYTLDPPPPDLTRPRRPAEIRAWRSIVEQGSGAAGRSPLCPPWGFVLSPAQVEALVAHLERLQDSGPGVSGPG